MNPLFSGVALGGLRLKNRIVSLAHGTALVERGVPTEDDFVAGHAGTVRADGLLSELERAGAVVRAIGDCLSPRRLTWNCNLSRDRGERRSSESLRGL